jgi:hypothetical protein
MRPESWFNQERAEPVIWSVFRKGECLQSTKIHNLSRQNYSVMQVVGIHEDACEVLFDADFPSGTDLNGR